MPIRFLDEAETEETAIPTSGTKIRFLDDNGDIAPVSAPSPIEAPVSIGVTEEPEEPGIQSFIEQQKQFEQTKIGKVLGAPGRLLGQKPLSERLARSEELKQLPTGQRLLGEARELVSETARATPLLVPATKAAKAGKLAQTFIEAAKNAAITGGAAGVESVAEGETPEEAAKKAGVTGATAGTLTLAIPGVAKGLKFGAKRLTKLFSDVKGYAIDTAIKNPKIIEGNLPKLVDAGESAKVFLDDHAATVKARFEDGLDALRVPSGKVITSDKVGKSIKSLGLDKDLLKSKLQTAANREAIDLSDDLVNRFVNGKKVGFREARKINSLLFDITKGKETEAIGKGLIGKLDRLKTALLRSMEDSVPGIKEVNKEFAVEAKRLTELNKIFGDPGKKEAQLRQLAKQIAGEQKNKTAVLRMFEEIPNSKKVLNDLLESAAAEEFENLGTPSVFRLMASSSLGGFAGGAPGAVLGAGATAALSSRPGLQTLARVGQAAERTGRALTPVSGLVSPVSREAGFQTRSLIRRREG